MNKEAYTTIGGQAESLLVIHKSKFLGLMVNVKSVDAANAVLERVRKQYWDASHNCFAYIIGHENPEQKASDDGEPGGTAGVPMLEVLKKNELTDVLVIVTRYFGGVKLGAGGLVRAYSSSVSETLKRAKIVQYEPCEIYRQNVEYDIWAKIEPKLVSAGALILKQEYLERVHLEIGLREADKPGVFALLREALKSEDVLTYITTDYVAVFSEREKKDAVK